MSEQLGSFILDFCGATGRVINLFLATCVRLKETNGRETIRQMARLGADSLPIVLMTIMFTGMVLAVQTSKEFVRFGAAASVGGVVAIAMGRELAPVLTGVVVAGRVGAAIAAEIAAMKVTEQIDALRVMATNPITYLVVPRFVAAVVMLPVLVVFANAIGSFGGWVVATNYADISSFTYINSIKVFMKSFDLVSGMIKGAVFGGIIAIIGCYKGLNAKQGAEGVGVATTAAVVLSIILIFISNYFLSLILFVSGG
ncbi:MAG TPA: ABC transporter permease [Candidatus Avacidaminococcus intestinavium]|uniref:ABC transporter permease n=1 Tax=Candidatus Avacidaminococcus intestinavium TaxID=2840684 RepID=A0A9D1MNF8_9FIRM|nr:ABC transporter permease [Candidatus Avacidaminococcus intestinavium]